MAAAMEQSISIAASYFAIKIYEAVSSKTVI
jgi:hypothetical protein